MTGDERIDSYTDATKGDYELQVQSDMDTWVDTHHFGFIPSSLSDCIPTNKRWRFIQVLETNDDNQS